MLTARASAASFPASKSAINASNDCGNESLLAAPHLACGAMVAIGVGVAQHVQSSVNHEADQLLAHPDPPLARIGAREVWCDVDVADYGCVHPSLRVDSRSRLAELERYHVRRPAMAEKFAVEPRDASIRHECNGNERLGYMLAATNAAHDLAYPILGESDSDSVARDIDGDTHALARESGLGSIVSGRGAAGYSIRP